MTLIFSFAQAAFIVLLAPGMVGFVRTLKARFQNRRGAPILLPYWSLLSLFRKEMTITRNSSWIFHAVPFVVFASALTLAFLIPTLGYSGGHLGDIFLVGAIMALGSVFLVFGGMDTASAFGNMGSSREMTLSALVEPALYVSLGTLAIIAGAPNLESILERFSSASALDILPIAALSLFALFLVFLSENARYPVDNPATHLELTMVHEAMVLEYSGAYLALLEYASAIKLTVLFAFLMDLVVPFGIVHLPFTPLTLLVACVALLGKLVLAALLVAFVESTIVKMRFYRMQEFMSLGFIVAFAGLLLALIFGRPL